MDEDVFVSENLLLMSTVLTSAHLKTFYKVVASLCLSVCCLLVTPCMSLSTESFKVSTEKNHLFLNISVVECDL